MRVSDSSQEYVESRGLITEGEETSVASINSKGTESLYFNPNLLENFKLFNNI